MEALGVAASIVAVVELGSKVSYKLFTFSRQVAHAGAALEDLAQEVASVNVVLQQLLLHLRQDEDASSKLCSDTLVQSARGFVDKCEAIFKGIEVLIMDGLEIKRLSLKQKLKFSFNAPTVEVHLSKLNGLKLSLLVTLNTLVYAEAVRSREQSFVLSSQLQILKSLHKEKIVIEAVTQAAKPEGTTGQGLVDAQFVQLPGVSNRLSRQDTGPDRVTSTSGISTATIEAPRAQDNHSPSKHRIGRQKRRYARQKAQRELADRLEIESSKRPVVPLSDDKEMILYLALVEELLALVNSSKFAELDMRKRFLLDLTVRREPLEELDSLLEPRGPYTAAEITACHRESSPLLKDWLQHLRQSRIPHVRSRSNSSTSSDSDYGPPMRTTATQILPIARNDRRGTQHLRSRVRPVPVINNYYSSDDRSRGRHYPERTRGRYRRSSTSESRSDGENDGSDLTTADVTALLESLTTLTSDEIAASLHVENE